MTGYAFPNAILQHALADLDKASIDIARLQRKRDQLVSALREAGITPTMIRFAVGDEDPGDLIAHFIAAAKLAIAGCAIGLLGAAATSRLLGSFLFGVSPFDPLVLTLAAVFVLLLTWLASWLPARRAASIDLMSVLRAD